MSVKHGLCAYTVSLLLLVSGTACTQKKSADPDPPTPSPAPPVPSAAPDYKALVDVRTLSAEEAKELVNEPNPIYFPLNAKDDKKVAICAGIDRLAFTPDGKTLIAGGVHKLIATNSNGVDGGFTKLRVKLWTLPTGKQAGMLEQATSGLHPPFRIADLAISPDGQRLWVGGGKIWSLLEQKALAEVHGVHRQFFHPNGKWVIGWSPNETFPRLWVFDAATAKIAEMHYYPDGKTPTAYGDTRVAGGCDVSADGAWLARVGYDRLRPDLYVDSLKPGQKSFQIKSAAKDPWYSPERLYFTADGRRVIGLCQREYGALETKHPSCIRAWSLADRKQLWEVEIPSHANDLAVSPDGHWAAVACGDKVVRLLATATGEEKRALTGHALPATAVAFSKDGKLLASADTDTVRVWKKSE